MPSRELPARPNLEQLKKQAKSLLACGAGARRRRRSAASPRCPRSRASPSIDIGAGSGAARRAVGDRARARIRVLERAARRSRSAHAVVRRGRRRVHPLRDRRRVRPREPAPRAASAICVGHAADGAGARRRRGGGSAIARGIRSSRPQPGGPQNWEPLLYVCHTCLHFKRACSRGGTRRDRAAALRARRESERRVSLELAPGASADGAVGRHLRDQASAARRSAARGRSESDRRRLGAHRRRRRQSRRARTAAPLRRQRERHPRRRAAARLHDAVGRQSSGPVLAARAWRGREPRLGPGR